MSKLSKEAGKKAQEVYPVTKACNGCEKSRNKAYAEGYSQGAKDKLNYLIDYLESHEGSLSLLKLHSKIKDML